MSNTRGLSSTHISSHNDRSSLTASYAVNVKLNINNEMNKETTSIDSILHQIQRQMGDGNLLCLVNNESVILGKSKSCFFDQDVKYDGRDNEVADCYVDINNGTEYKIYGMNYNTTNNDINNNNTQSSNYNYSSTTSSSAITNNTISDRRMKDEMYYTSQTQSSHKNRNENKRILTLNYKDKNIKYIVHTPEIVTITPTKK